MTKAEYEEFLYEALGEALPDMPEYMGPEKEALALVRQCAIVMLMTADGNVPVTKLMALCTQAMRVAVEAMAQGDNGPMVNVVGKVASA